MRPCGLHPVVERRAGVGGQDVEGGGLDALLDRPLDGALEDGFVVLVHAEDEAGVDHHAELVQAADGGGVIPVQVLSFVLLAQVFGVERLEADEQAAQTAGGGFFEQTRLQDRSDRPGSLPEAAHAAHPVEQRGGEARVAEQVVVQEVQVAAGQAVDLGQRLVDRAGVERLAAGEEGLLVAEIAGVRAAARDHQRVGHQVERALDQVAADRRQALQRALGRSVAFLRAAQPGNPAERPARCLRRDRGRWCRRGRRPLRAGR